MKRKITVVVLVPILILSMFTYGIYWAFYDIQRLDGQEKLKEATSPDGRYTVTAYLNNGGATTDYAVLCSVKNNDSEKEKNIYWQYHCENANIAWVDGDTVQINGIELDVEKDTYDYRHD